MKLLSRFAAFCIALCLTLGFTAMAAEKNEKPQDESSAFIGLQLENISEETGREATETMLLGTLNSLNGGESTVKVMAAPEQKGLQFTGVSVAAFASVLVLFGVLAWLFFSSKRRTGHNKF